MKRRLLALLAGLAGSLLPVLADAQRVGAPIVDPPALHQSSGPATTITIASSIVDSNDTLLPNSVNLLFIPVGGPPQIIGTLNDAGVNGDVLAKDGVYTARFSATDYPFSTGLATPGLLRFRVSAAFRGQLLRRQSDSATLEVLDRRLPDDIRPSDPANAVPDPSFGFDIVCNEVLMQAPLGASADLLFGVADSIRGTIVGFLAGDDVNTWQVEVPGQPCPPAGTIRQDVDAIDNLPSMRGATPNTIGTIAGAPPPNDRRFPFQYGLENIEVLKAWTMTTGAHPHFPLGIPARTVAIVDSGIDYDHPDLTGKVIKGKNYAVNPPTRDPMDLNGHGTHVAGIAAASTNNNGGIAGVCWTCKLLAVKVTDGPITPTAALQLAAGIRNAVANHAQILNLSLQNYPNDEQIARQINHANRAGALVVAAAGNANSNVKSYPGGFDDEESYVHRFFNVVYDTRVVTVGAVDRTNHHGTWAGGGSNYGTWVEIVAPGVDVLSTYRNVDYREMSGTSMATPHVSGVAALAAAGRSSFDARRMRDALLQTTTATGNSDPDGNGLRQVDAFSAVFQGLASACSSCPQAPDVRIQGAEVFMGLTAPGDQRMSVHGVSVPLRPPGGNGRYLVHFQANLLTFDSYNARTSPDTGYFDLFSLSVSSAAYYNLRLTDPIVSGPGLAIGFTFGGTRRNSGGASTGPVDVSLRMSGGNTSFLNVVLDTRALPDADRLYPSSGTFKVLDITPE